LKHSLHITLLLPLAAFATGLQLPNVAHAASTDFALVIKDQHFVPAELAIPSGAKIKLKVENQDGIPVEFESTDLSREVIVPGHGEVTIYVGPLNQGNYQFFNDFNRDMQGVIVAKPAVNKEN
jgi:hypothetical protein